MLISPQTNLSSKSNNELDLIESFLLPQQTNGVNLSITIGDILRAMDNNGNGFNQNTFSAVSFDKEIYYEKPEELLIPWIMNPLFTPILITYIVTFIVGVTGNMLVIWLMLGNKNNRNVTTMFLVSLSVSDLLLLIIYTPLEIINYFVLYWDKEGTICRLSAFAESVSAFGSVLNLVAVTLERFVVIMFPIQSRFICAMHNCKRMLAIVWIAALALATPVIFLKSTTKTTFTNYETTVHIYLCKETNNLVAFILNMYRFLIMFLVPSIIMIACYTRVIIELWMSALHIDQAKVQTDNNSTPHSILEKEEKLNQSIDSKQLDCSQDLSLKSAPNCPDSNKIGNCKNNLESCKNQSKQIDNSHVPILNLNFNELIKEFNSNSNHCNDENQKQCEAFKKENIKRLKSSKSYLELNNLDFNIIKPDDKINKSTSTKLINTIDGSIVNAINMKWSVDNMSCDAQLKKNANDTISNTIISTYSIMTNDPINENSISTKSANSIETDCVVENMLSNSKTINSISSVKQFKRDSNQLDNFKICSFEIMEKPEENSNVTCNYCSSRCYRSITFALNKLNFSFQKAKTRLKLKKNKQSKDDLKINTILPPTSHRVILRTHMRKEVTDMKTARKQVIKMLILIVLLFLLCWGPRLTMEVIIKCCLDVYNHSTYNLRVVFYLLPFVHSCLNPIVYCFMSSKFRNQLIALVKRLRFSQDRRTAKIDLMPNYSSRRTTIQSDNFISKIITIETSDN